MKITPEYFLDRVGSPPENDDLERCNCAQAGEILHESCGWCTKHDMPIFCCTECIEPTEGKAMRAWHVKSTPTGKTLFAGTESDCRTYIRRTRLCPYCLFDGSELIEKIEWF